MDKYKISVITLSFDNQEFTEKFVHSIRENSSLNYELIIVDNGSNEKTQNWVKTEFPKNWDILLLENFSKYNNLGLVSPVYTAGAGQIALRQFAVNNKILLNKFGDYPSGVAYFVNKRFINSIIGGWSEDYYIASGEDADFCY